MAIYDQLGFKQHPFTTTNADEEPFLKNYFVDPPYFDVIVGDSDYPSASIVLAPRGAGKTALKRMVESHGIEEKYLAVTYDSFEFSKDESPETISLGYHLKNIITRILISFLSYMSEEPDLTNKFTKEEKQNLSIFIRTYLGDLTGSELQVIMSELKSLPEKFSKFWSDNIGILDTAVNFLFRAFQLPVVDTSKLTSEQKSLSQTYKYQLKMLLSFVRKLGFKSIYILIDKVDETEKTGNDPEATYKLVKPLIKDLDLLGSNGYGFKFFLWDAVEPNYKSDARPDRVKKYDLIWDRDGLKEILSERLKAFSGEKVVTISQLIDNESDTNWVDDAICIIAKSSPRNVIRICEKILANQSLIDRKSKSLTIQAVDRGIIDFCEEITDENYGSKVVKELQKVGRELFTINYVGNDVFKITNPAANSKVLTWSNIGAVSKIGTISIPGSKKPLNFYCIKDPAIIRLIHRRTPLEQFISDRWLPCSDCGTDNLMDIDYFTDNNDPTCMGCGRNVI